MRAAWCAAVLTFAACLLACGGAGKRSGGNSERDVAASLLNATESFESVKQWCEDAYKQDASELKANPIRGKESRASHEQQIKAALIGKPFRWVMTITGIDANGTVGLSAYHFASREEHRPTGTVTVNDFFLSVQLQQPADFRGADIASNPIYHITDVPPEVLRALTKGASATVTGEIETVSVSEFGTYTVKTRGAKIQK